MPDGKPVPYLAEPFLADQSQFSPDGRWTACVCNESGTNQIFVQSLPIGSGNVHLAIERIQAVEAPTSAGSRTLDGIWIYC